MNIYWWFLVGASITCYLYTWYRVHGIFAWCWKERIFAYWHTDNKLPSIEGIITAGILAAIAAVPFPLTLPWTYLVERDGEQKINWEKILYKPKALRP